MIRVIVIRNKRDMSEGVRIRILKKINLLGCWKIVAIWNKKYLSDVNLESLNSMYTYTVLTNHWRDESINLEYFLWQNNN